MEFKTKYQINDLIYFVDAVNNIISDFVSGITITMRNEYYDRKRFPDGIAISYSLQEHPQHYEYEIFATKDEAIEYFLEKTRVEYVNTVNNFLNLNTEEKECQD